MQILATLIGNHAKQIFTGRKSDATIWRLLAEQGIEWVISSMYFALAIWSTIVSNAYRAYRTIERRRCRQVMVGTVPIGGDAPISVQTMTNSLTSDIPSTLAQINAATNAGADIVRVSCPDKDSTAALKTICAQSPVPIVADIHFHYRRAIEAAKAGAAVCASIRVILAMRRGCARLFRLLVTMVVQCGLGSMRGH